MTLERESESNVIKYLCTKRAGESILLIPFPGVFITKKVEVFLAFK